MPRLVTTGCLAVLIALPVAGPATEMQLTMEDAIEVMRAATAVLAVERGLEEGMRHCRERHAELARPGRASLDAWTRRNEPALVRSRQLSEQVMQAVAERSGEAQASRLRARLYEDTHHQARELAATLQARPDASQDYLCNRFIEAIEQGQWDIAASQPQAYRILMAR